MTNNRILLPALAAFVMLVLAPRPSSAQVHCTATFRLASTVTLGALQLDVDYPTPAAAFDGSGTSVACTNFATALPNFLDNDAGTLALAWVAFGGSFSGPSKLATCEMTNQAAITKNDLVVTVIDASDPSSNKVAAPAISTSVLCDGGTTTTVTTSTTTTTLPTSEVCSVKVDMTDPVKVGSLQVDVDYAAASGEFQDTGSNVKCSNLASGSLGTFHDDDAGRTVSGAFISLSGFTGPLTLFQCTFLPDGQLPLAADFSLSVTDAGDPNSNPIVPRPAVSISAIDCFDPNATTTTTTTTTVPACGDGVVQAGEECDDGNAVDGDGCRPSCVLDMCGDADLNERITASDAQRILHASVGLPVSCPPGICDTSGDGNVTVPDAQRVLRFSVGLPSPLLCR
jgi:cysteine-rich repeat protein